MIPVGLATIYLSNLQSWDFNHGKCDYISDQKSHLSALFMPCLAAKCKGVSWLCLSPYDIFASNLRWRSLFVSKSDNADDSSPFFNFFLSLDVELPIVTPIVRQRLCDILSLLLLTPCITQSLWRLKNKSSSYGLNVGLSILCMMLLEKSNSRGRIIAQAPCRPGMPPIIAYIPSQSYK